MSLVDDAERGRLAEAVLDNPVYSDSYTKIEQGLIQAWQTSRSAAEREELHQLHRMLAKVRELMVGTMNSGKIAQSKLEQRETLRQRAGRALAGD